MGKEIDLYKIFPKAKDIKFPMRIPRKRKPKPKEEDIESLVERYATESAHTQEDAQEVSNLMNQNALSDE